MNIKVMFLPIVILLFAVDANSQQIRPLVDSFLVKNVENYNEIVRYQNSDKIEYQLDTAQSHINGGIVCAISFKETDFRMLVYVDRASRRVMVLKYGQQGNEKPVIENIRSMFYNERHSLSLVSHKDLRTMFLSLVFPQTICVYHNDGNSFNLVSQDSDCTPLDEKLPVKVGYVAVNNYSKPRSVLLFDLCKTKDLFVIKVKNKRAYIKTVEDFIGSGDSSFGIYPKIKGLPMSSNYLKLK